MKTSSSVVLGIIIVVAIIAGAFIYTSNNKNAPTTQIDIPEPVGTVTQTPTPTPSAPTVTTSANAVTSDTTAILTGNVTPNGTLTSYWYEYGATDALGTKTITQSVGSGYTVTKAPGYITGLTKDTSYYYRLVAENQNGRFAGTQYQFRTTTGNPAPVGGIPDAKTLAATNVTMIDANLNGEVTANKTATTYWFEYGKTTSLGNVTALVGVSDTSVKAAATRQITNLEPNTTYYFRLDAQNQFGTVNGTIMSLKTDGPVVPVAVTATTRSATSVATTSATLRGTVNAHGIIMTYWFEYGTSSSFATSSLHTTAVTTVSGGSSDVAATANLTGLATSTTYYFRLVGQNTLGTVRGASMSFRTDRR